MTSRLAHGIAFFGNHRHGKLCILDFLKRPFRAIPLCIHHSAATCLGVMDSVISFSKFMSMKLIVYSKEPVVSQLRRLEASIM